MAEAAGEAARETHDVRPLVARPASNRAVWLFGAVLLAAGAGMFYALQVRREALENPSLLAPQPVGKSMIASPPELAIPPAPAFEQWQQAANGPLPAPAPDMPDRRPDYSERGNARFAQSPLPPPPRAEPSAPSGMPFPPSPGLVYQAPPQPVSPSPGASGATDGDGRVEARTFRNPGTTVPQGSVLQAVMETALDSTRAGFARAIVSRDVRSFDGTRVLIPKGSRLFGSYQADVSLGQKRALIQWKRLTRPDGTIIDLDSPSADPLGRAGVRGKVNTHFFQRFGGAILQSILDVGVRVASQEAAGDTVIVGLPGATTQATTIQNPADIKPTLKIAQGASVSVFVARDLDFSTVER